MHHIYIIRRHKTLAKGGSTMVEHSPHHPKVKGSSPASTAAEKKENF
jgi:hypothetical protein